MSLEVLSAGAKLLGGLGSLFGKKSSPSDQVVARVGGAVRAAKKHGVNVLEILRSGTANVAGAEGTGPRIASSMAQISDGFDAFESAIAGDKARARKAEELENDLRRISIDEARRGGLVSPSGARGGWASEGLPGAPAEEGGGPLEPGRNTITSVDGTFSYPFASDAETAEARYGDAAQEIYGAKNLASDVWYPGVLRNVAEKRGVSMEEQHRDWIERGYAAFKADVEKYRAGYMDRAVDAVSAAVPRMPRMTSPAAQPDFRPTGKRRAEDMNPATGLP